MDQTSTEDITLMEVKKASNNMNNWIRKLRKGLKSNMLLIATIVSVALGVILGILIRRLKPTRNTVHLIGVPGEVLMRMFKLLLLPLVSSSMVSGSTKYDGVLVDTVRSRTMLCIVEAGFLVCMRDDIHKSSMANLNQSRGKLGIAALTYYICTTVLATVLGIGLALTVRPGQVMKYNSSSKAIHDQPLPETTDAILDLLRNIIPENVMQASFQHSKTTFTKYMAELRNSTETAASLTNHSPNNFTYGGDIWQKSVSYLDGMNVIGILVFFAVFGVMLNNMGESGRVMVDLFNILNRITMNMTQLVMWYNPIGILFIIMSKILEVRDLETAAQQLAMYMVTGLFGLAIHALIVLPVIYFLLTRQNPFRVSLGLTESLLTGLGTSSSAAALPVTLRCCEEKMKFNKAICRFVLPIGATINMDGLAIIQALTPIFLAQMNYRTLALADLVAISLTATMSSIGAAGVPGTGFITMLVVVAAVGLPVEDAYIVLSVDWFMMRMVTMVNIYNDGLAAGILTRYFSPSSSSVEMSDLN